jgi:hypothetical protein
LKTRNATSSKENASLPARDVFRKDAWVVSEELADKIRKIDDETARRSTSQ